jgi:TonB-dependent SusC/RagA subfamily outer membrane receptor
MMRQVLVASVVLGCYGALHAGSASAQVTYSVFPAQDANAISQVHQPTNPDARAVVSLEIRDSTIGYVVRALAYQAHLRPIFNDNNPLMTRRIAVHLADMNVMDAFAVVLKGTGLAAKLRSDGETVMIGASSTTSAAARGAQLAGGTILGRVTDSVSGSGLSGVSVKVEGIKLSTVTSDSGHFTLRNVPPGEQVLAVRLFGYRPVERTVAVTDSDSTTIRVVMVSVPTVLSGVVTTATGLVRKVEVGNDITTLNVDSIRQVAPIMSVTDLLETRVPGLTVMHTSGVPGDPSRLRLRGASSIIGNNDPIIIVDGIRVYSSQSDPRNNNLAPSVTGGSGVGQGNGTGVSGSGAGANLLATYAAPSPLDQIDPNTIETIEVFKGPSASALYGSDAANGVIVITTKHGRAGPTHWDAELGQGVNWVPGSWPTNYFRFGKYDVSNNPVLGTFCVWSNPLCTVDSVVAFQALNEPQYSLFAHGSDRTASLNVSGGVPTITYNLAGSVADNLGSLKLPVSEQQRYTRFYGPIPGSLVRPDDYTTEGVNGTLTVQPSAAMHVTLQTSLFTGTQTRSSLEGAISQLEGAYLAPPGVFVTPSGGTSQAVFDSLTTTPLIQNDVEQASDNSVDLTNALTFQWQAKPWLPLSATYGNSTIQRSDQTYVPFGVNNAGPGTTFVDTLGSYGVGRGVSKNQTLSFGTTIPLPHTTLALGGNAYSQSTADFSAWTGQLAPGVSTPSTFPTSCPGMVSACSSLGQTTADASTFGWYLEPRLNFSSRFFVAPGFRLDGGSGGTHSTVTGPGVNNPVGGLSSPGLGSVNALSAFPKLDFSYVVVDQNNPKGPGRMLTLLRPRLAFGLAGTQPGPADKLRLVNNVEVGALNDTTTVPLTSISDVGNTRLSPETSRELEGGVDAELWHGRVSLTWTQYNKTRYKAIIPLPVAPSVNFSVGNGVLNNGDVRLLFSNQQDVNVGTVRNTGTELTATLQLLERRAMSWTVSGNLSNDNNLLVKLAPGFVPNKSIGIVAGYPLFSEWVLPIVNFADANHDGIIEPNEIRFGDSLVYAGQQVPSYQMNFSSDLSVLNGRLSVHATFAYQNGLTQDNRSALSSGAFALLPNAPGTPLATQAAVVAATTCSNTGTTFFSQCGSPFGLIQTVNTFRFSDFSVNYMLPKTVAAWFRVPRMMLAVQGSNLWLHSNYRGKDPDVNAFSTVSAGDETADTGQIPEPRVFWLKLTMGN